MVLIIMKSRKPIGPSMKVKKRHGAREGAKKKPGRGQEEAWRGPRRGLEEPGGSQERARDEPFAKRTFLV